MITVRHFIFCISLICLTIKCVGQDGYIPPKIPSKYCKALDDAVLASVTGNTEESIKVIKQLIAKYPTWTLPRQQLSRIYYQTGKKNDAIETLKASITIDTNTQLQQLHTLGRLYEETGDLDNARLAYKVIIRKGIHQQGLVQQASASLEALEEKTRLFKTDYSISLSAMPEGINTKDHEALGRWTIDGKQLIFTRWIDRQEDLFIALFNETGQLLSVEEMSFNTEYSEGGHTISPDGKYIVFTSCDRRDGMGGCDLYLSVLKDGTWGSPINMGPAFNSVGWDSEPVFGLDGLSIYFASTRPGGFGGSDIWMVKEISGGKWSAPINAGSRINTTNNEESPFIHFDGRTIYFMRDGKGGLGGFDLFLAHMNIDDLWQEAENMGFPINSGSDEGALAIHPDGKRALITRKTTDRRNDLFEFELPARYQSTPVQVLYVNVTDQETKKPVRARLEVFNVSELDTIRISQLADEKGSITVTLNRNESYGIIASANGYIMHSSNLPGDSGAVRNLDIEIIPIAFSAEKTIVLRNIFFETGSSKLLPSSDPELNKLLWTLRDNENMKIEIRGHTDNVGTEEDNQILSEARAKSVYQYLIERGIDASRLSYKGYGESRPVATNENEAGRKQNRRTEFVIVSS